MVNPIEFLRQRIIRYRRSRGFGVHSPFAFGLITHVLTCRYPYYCFDALKADIAHAGGSLRPSDALALFRLLDVANPATAAIAPQREKSVELTVKAWKKRCRIVAPDKAEFIIMTAPTTLPQPSENSTIFLCRDAMSLYPALRETMTAGMTFTNGQTAVGFCNPKLPRQDFEISY